MTTARLRSIVDPLLLLAPAATLLALSAPRAQALDPALATAIALASFAGWLDWLRRRGRPDRERWVVGIALVAATVTLGVDLTSSLTERARPAGEHAIAEERESYRAYWRELELRAAGAAADLAAEPAALSIPARAFAVLERGTWAPRVPGLTLLLVDADGDVEAWAGRGLLREPTFEGALAPGRSVEQSHATATARVVAAVPGRGNGERALWVVAGESRPLAGEPPLLGAPKDALRRSWRFGESPPDAAWLPVGESDLPGLQLGPFRAPRPGARTALVGLPAAAFVVGLGLFGLAALRATALGVLAATVLRRRVPFGELVFVGTLALVLLGRAAGAPGAPLAALAFALVTAVFAARARLVAPPVPFDVASAPAAAPDSASRIGGVVAELARLLPFVAGALVAVVALRAPGTWPDLAERGPFDAPAAVLRLAATAFLFGALAAAATVAPAASGRRFLAAGLVALVVGGALHDAGPFAAAILVAAFVMLGRGVASVRLAAASALAALALLAALASSVAWQWGSRAELVRTLPDLAEPLMPPSAERLAATERRLERHFRAFDLAAITSVADTSAGAPGEEAPLETSDLAYALWRDSPLARLDAASALVVEPEDGAPSAFSFGFPLDDDLAADRAPARWEAVGPAAWRELERQGDGAVVAGGREVGAVRWYFVPLPGFGVRDAEIRDLPTTMLGAKRSSELAVGRALQLPPDAGVAALVFGAEGEIELSPWREGTPTLASLRVASVAGSRRVATPSGPARFALREAPGATLVLLAPVLGPLRALERIGVQVAGTLFLLAVLGLAGALLALPRATARELLARTFRSYSKRLVLVYSLLLLAPLVLLYALLSESLGRRVLDEQRLAAQAALTSVQRILGEYVLSLQPGFGLDTALDDDLLVWLSRVVGHEIHLYWNGVVYASSQRQLFVAGFLPRRVPGEVWRGEALGGERLMTRTTEAGEARYVELYAPLLVPGIDPRASRLLLSMPLLAQQEEATIETARIRQRTLLATLGAFLLLGAVGIRLARSFTRPITDLVAGTRRIAAGSPSLGVELNVDELSALGEAIDQMARRIAEGRAQILREKRLVDGIVESVTSGVVAVDRSGRVLLANRVARLLLDVEPGERLVDRLAKRRELADIHRFVSAAASEPVSGSARAVRTANEERDWSLVWVPLSDADEAGALFVVEDVSEVLRAQRLEAWAAMARLIAHEIKNPLTPIRLSAEHLRDVWQRDRSRFESVLERCTTNILVQVDELREIASEFSVYSHIPRTERVEGDVVAALGEIAEGYAAAPPPGVAVRFAPDAEEIRARFDPKLLGRAVRNLLENAVRATKAGGTVELRIAADDELATILVTDEGPGVPEEQLARIFEPYFSTHAGGTGLGLPIALRIAEEHGGTIRARNRPSGGLEVAITIPRQ